MSLVGVLLIQGQALIDLGMPPGGRVPARLAGGAILFVGFLLCVGGIKVALRACDRERATARDALPSIPLLWQFLLGSVAYGAAVAASVAVTFLAIALAAFGVARAYRGPGPLAQTVALVAAGGLGIVAYGLTVWTVDRQFFGQFLVDRGGRAGEALRLSVSIARPARGGLLLFDTVILGLAAIAFLPGLLMGAPPRLPRDVHLPVPPFTLSPPPGFAPALKELAVLLGILVGWVALIAQTHVYRRLDREASAREAPVPASGSPR